MEAHQGIPGVWRGTPEPAPVLPLRPATDLDALVDTWIGEYTSAETIEKYAGHVRRVIRDLDATNPADLAPARVATWAARDGANNTVRTRITAVRSFLRWCVTNGRLDHLDDTALRRALRSYPRTYGKVQAARPARFLTHDEAFTQLLGVCDDTDRGLRDQLAIRLGLLGMRSHEIQTVTYRSLRTLPVITWTGKNRKPRRAAAGHALSNLIDRYTERYEQAMGRPVTDDDPVICATRRGKPYNVIRWGVPYTDRQGIEKLVKRAARLANLGSVAPHDLRRTAASVLHNSRTTDGAHHFDLLDIQQVLGHSDPAITMRCYIEPMDTGLLHRAANVLD